SYFEELYAALQHLANSGVEYRTVFLDAEDHVLLQRFEAGRRPHPMQGNARLLDGIRAERDVVEPLKARADVVVDTTELNVHGL
ncbi:RNase adaptor protein RapZ, partial [Streptococcus anginosus]|nr:RNase adaptor protein RapZ [Streptococcus anginosus]